MFLTEVTGNRVSDHYARKLCKGLSKNSCSVDLIDIKNTLLKTAIFFENTISALQVFSPELISPIVSFSGIFLIH